MPTKIIHVYSLPLSEKKKINPFLYIYFFIHGDIIHPSQYITWSIWRSDRSNGQNNQWVVSGQKDNLFIYLLFFCETIE